jgi:hypothetical protein
MPVLAQFSFSVEIVKLRAVGLGGETKSAIVEFCLN